MQTDDDLIQDELPGMAVVYDGGPLRWERELPALPDIIKEFERHGETSDDTRPDTQALIRRVCDELRDFLVEKNEQYGDSAINPVRIFSNASADEQLLVRIDDKLSRLARGDDRLETDEDVINDLLGYLILYKVLRLRDADA